MDKMVIEGGIPLKGSVRISGAKNAALPIMAACLLTGGTHLLENVPHLRDIDTMKRIMGKFGAVFKEENGSLEVTADDLTCHEAPYELVKTMRASILLLGPLLARLGKPKFLCPADAP